MLLQVVKLTLDESWENNIWSPKRQIFQPRLVAITETVFGGEFYVQNVVVGSLRRVPEPLGESVC